MVISIEPNQSHERNKQTKNVELLEKNIMHEIENTVGRLTSKLEIVK